MFTRIKPVGGNSVLFIVNVRIINIYYLLQTLYPCVVTVCTIDVNINAIICSDSEKNLILWFFMISKHTE